MGYPPHLTAEDLSATRIFQISHPADGPGVRLLGELDFAAQRNLARF